MTFFVFFAFLVLATSTAATTTTVAGSIVHSSGNPVILRFRESNWRSYLLSLSSESPIALPSLEDKMHADLQLLCPVHNPAMDPLEEENHEVDSIRLLGKYVSLLPGHNYCLASSMWKRIVGIDTQSDFATLRQCLLRIIAKPNMAMANREFEDHPDLSQWWIQLPFHRATERLFVRGGHEAKWIDDTDYEQSFALRALPSTEKVGRLDIFCGAFLDQYALRNPILASYLFRTDEQPVEDYAFLFANVSDFSDFEERTKETLVPLVQPSTFLSSSWPDFQAYLDQELHCDMEFVSEEHVLWMSIQEWNAWHERKARDLVERFSYLEIIERTEREQTPFPILYT
jgi:hypothetical protein